MKTIITLIASTLLTIALTACASTGTAMAEAAVKPEIKAAPSPERVNRLKEIIEAKERELQLQSSLDVANEELKARSAEMEMLMKKVDELSKGQAKSADLEDIARTKEENRNLQRENEALKARLKDLYSAGDAQKLKGQIAELKSRIEHLKWEYVAPEKHQAAIDDAQRLYSENSALQAENAGLKQALAEAKARGDDACKFVEQLTARFDALSRKYEQLNEHLGRRK